MTSRIQKLSHSAADIFMNKGKSYTIAGVGHRRYQSTTMIPIRPLVHDDDSLNK